MTATTPPTASPSPPASAPMDLLRRTAFLGGAFYVLTFLSSIPATLLLSPVLDDPQYVLGAGRDTQVLSAAGLEIVNALAAVATAVVLYPVVKRQSQTLALGFVASRVLEAAILFTGIVSVLAVVTLRQDVAGSAGADDASLVTVAAGLVAVRDWTLLFGPGMAIANALLLGTLMYRSRLVPRVIPLLGLVGAPLLLIGNVLTMFGYTEPFSLLTVITLPGIFFWELSLGVYLMVKGFRPAPILAVPAAPAPVSGAGVTAGVSR